MNFGKLSGSENYKGIEILRITINRSLRNKLHATYLIQPFYRIIWKRRIGDLIKRFKINVVHVHDLPLSDIPISLRKKYNIKVVCDQHEFYSNWIVKTAHYNTFIGKLVKALSNWNKFERNCLKEADLVLTVEDPLKKIYIAKLGLNEDKVVVLPNTPDSYIFNPSRKDPKISEKYVRKFVIFYAGHIDILRGINTIIDSLPLLRDRIPTLKFVFAGHFTKKYYDPLKYIENLGVSDLTDYLGWIPVTDLPYYISASNICIHIPPATSIEVNNSIATKVYQYALMNKPIIVGQAKLMKSFVEGNGIGLSIKDSNPEDLAEKIFTLYSSPPLVKKFTDNTKKLTVKISWENTSKPFIEFYKTLNQ